MFHVTSFEVMVTSSYMVRSQLTRNHHAPIRDIAWPDGGRG
jgi:hypothetical protein